jgi:gliding motility-associated lipoprotein GldH
LGEAIPQRSKRDFSSYSIGVKFCLLIMVSAGLFSCDSQRVYETNKDFENGQWPQRDTVEFVFVIADTTQAYNLLLNVRNTLDYETARLFLNYTLTDSAGQPMRKRLLENMLFDRKTGEPFGKSGLGNIYDHQIPVEPRIKFPYAGSYTVRLTHMMRVDSLQEMLSVGVRVEKAN